MTRWSFTRGKTIMGLPALDWLFPARWATRLQEIAGSECYGKHFDWHNTICLSVTWFAFPARMSSQVWNLLTVRYGNCRRGLRASWNNRTSHHPNQSHDRLDSSHSVHDRDRAGAMLSAADQPANWSAVSFSSDLQRVHRAGHSPGWIVSRRSACRLADHAVPPVVRRWR